MLPIKKIYIDSLHSAKVSTCSSDFKIELPINLTLPHNTAFYITDITIPVSWYTIESGRNNIIYFRINGAAYSASKATIPEGNYSTITLAQAMAEEMHKKYPFGVTTGVTPPVRFVASSNLTSNTITINNNSHPFEILTDDQAGSLISGGQLTGSFPLNSINTVIKNTVPKTVQTSDSFTSGFVDLFPIRNLYLISNTLGTNNSMSINGEWGILKKIPVNAGYNEIVYDQTVLGMDYLDCSNQTLSRIDFKIKDHNGNTVNLHENHVSFSIIFVKVADE